MSRFKAPNDMVRSIGSPQASLSRRTAVRGLAGGLAAAGLVAAGRPGRIAAQDAATPGATPAVGTPAADGTVTLEFLGWSHFRLTSTAGKVILLNPWVEGNPAAAITMADITQADLILASQGHPDDQGNTVQIAQQTGALVFEPFELGTWMIANGVPEDQVRRSGQGGRLQLDGVTVRMVNAVHGASISPPTPTPYGGLSAGYVITFENGWTVYFDGNSAATQDMALWAELYQPHAMIFNLGPGREPLDAAMAIRLAATNNPNLATLIPHHRVPSAPGATTVEEVRAALDGMGVSIPILEPEPARPYSFPE